MIGTALVLTILEKSFEKWAVNQGTAAITGAADSISAWSLESILHLGPTKAAKRRLSKRLKSDSELLTIKLQQQQESYETLPGRLFKSAGIVGSLPFRNFALVPRAVVNREALLELKGELGESALLAQLDKKYFFDSIVEDFDKLLFEASKPSMTRPILSWKSYMTTYSIIAKGRDSKWESADLLQTKYQGYFIVTDLSINNKEQKANCESQLQIWQGEIAGWSQEQWNLASGFKSA